MDALLTLDGAIALATLTVLEIVLGIDNIIFISILAGRIPEARRAQARSIGLSLALVLRLVMLLGATWIAQLSTPLFEIPALLAMDAPLGVSGRDLIMLGGGLFLLAKATTELHSKLEGASSEGQNTAALSFHAAILQIIVLDVVFSIDSVITAIGLAQSFAIMAIAVVIAVGVMQLTAKSIGEFIERHPTIKILALSFLLMVGLVLITDGFHVHVPRGYLYFAMTFSIGVEFLNMRYRSKTSKDPVRLR